MEVNDTPIPNPSRQQLRALRTIVREFLRHPRAIVRFDDTGVVHGYRFTKHEEGGIRRCCEAFVSEEGKYLFRLYTDAWDCDGRTSNEELFLMAKAQKRRRMYLYKSGPVRGRFTPTGRFRVVARIDEQQRDYRAEAAGY